MKKTFVFCFDKNYAQYCSAALLSLITSNGTAVKIYCIFDASVGDDDLKNLNFLKKHFNVDIEFIKINAEKISGMKTHGHFTSAVYLRFYIPDLITKEDRAVYLDCDTIIAKDLTELFEINMDQYDIGGIHDARAQNISKIDHPLKEKYINSGVLLMNLKRLRENNLLKRSIDAYAVNAEKIIFPDQCLLNIVTHGNKLILDEKYNRLVRSKEIPRKEWNEIKDASNIFHFVEAIKPWHESSRNHVADFWWSYAKLTGNEKLHLQRCSSIQELIYKARSLEDAGNFERSCKLKEAIIDALIKSQKKSKSGNF